MPSCFHKITKDGFPVYYQFMSQFNADEFLKLGTVEEMVKYALNIAEKLEREYFKICSKIKGKYIHGTVSVIDFSGINSSILNTKLLSYLKKISKVQNYYPEMLEGSYVVNANLLFRSFYSLCKVFIDAKIKSKIKLFGADYKSNLLERIDSENGKNRVKLKKIFLKIF